MIERSDEATKLQQTRELVSDFYGRRVQSTADLQATACCIDEAGSPHRDVLKLIPLEVRSKQYGCGSPIPREDLSGLTVVDLGSGAGTDCFVLSKLVGPSGRVIGLDMTEPQLEVARRNVAAVTKAFGHAAPNVEFHRDYIETADTVASGTVDLVVSNCVINLSPFKEQVFRAIWRMLKPGGDFYVSDIVCDRRLPEAIRQDARLYGECLAGAEYENDLRDAMELAGFRDVREVARRELSDRVGDERARFSSVTLRGFKLADLDRRCEDYGQIAEYLGGCAEQPAAFRLDGGHLFEARRPVAVCRNTASMLAGTRLRRWFAVTEPRKHFGLFDCAACAPKAAPGAQGAPASSSSSSSSCC